jgi:hypothetical protein
MQEVVVGEWDGVAVGLACSPSQISKKVIKQPQMMYIALPVSLAGGTVTKAGRSASLLAWVCGLLIGLFSSPALRVDFLQVPPLLAHFGSWPNLEMLSSRRGSGLAKIWQLRAVAHPAGRRFQFFDFCYCTSFLSRKRAEVALLGLY